MSRNSRLQRLFSQKASGEKVMSLFVTAGFPDPSATVDLVLELEASGADIIELGMPFSDPLADGPTIQYASKVALDKGVTLDAIFSMVSDIRRRSDIPIVLMGYINPVYRYGIDAFYYKAKQSGVDGIILPDVPPDEFPEISELCRQTGIDPIYLVAPNTPDARMQEIDRASSGFVYCVSVTGVTGAREGGEISRSVNLFIKRVRKNVTINPVLIGFGIRSHGDAMAISGQVSGFIVGSALIEVIRESYPEPDWLRRTADFVRSLKHGAPQDA
ncbi:MAG: tryptophan synthase subunit alpha [Cyclonatronaceae bacterium]